MEEEVKTQSQVVVGVFTPAKHDKTVRSGRFAVENRARASFTNEHQSSNCQEAGDE